MATPTEAALDHHADRQRLATDAANFAMQQWSKVDRNNIAKSWLRLLPGVAAAITMAQFRAAGQADPYMDRTAAASTVDALVSAAAFAGAAADGRSLVSLLFQPVIIALKAILGGSPTDRAMAGGASKLNMIVRSEVADAGRVADRVALVARPDVAGYIRVAVGDSCNRCIILAGRWYRYSEGFRRHPRCDCIMLPASQAESARLVQDPMAIYESMTERQRTEAGWSEADQIAIDAGADLNQVTNAQRGTYTAGGRQYTTEGTTRRGLFGGYEVNSETGRLRRRRGGAKPRLTPDQIIADSGDRDEAIRLLQENGYLLGAPTEVDREPAAEPVAKPATDTRDLPVAVWFSAWGVPLDVDNNPIEGQYRDVATAIRDTATELEQLAQTGAGFSTVRRAANEQLDQIMAWLYRRDDLTRREADLREQIAESSPDAIVTILRDLADDYTRPVQETEVFDDEPAGDVDLSQLTDDDKLVGALIPTSWRDVTARQDQIKAVFAERLNGTYAGLRVEVKRLNNIDQDTVDFEAWIFDESGSKVGTTVRQFNRADSGRLWVYHAYLKLDSKVQGQGFAEAWNDHLMAWYVESGLDRIEVTANIDVGGYTWARQGFDWGSKSDAINIGERLNREVKDNVHLYDAQQLAAAEAILVRLGGDFRGSDYPTAYEMSQVGRKPGQSKKDPWPGKQAMLGSMWSGVKPVRKKLVPAKPAPLQGQAILDAPQARMVVTEHSTIAANELARVPENQRILYVRETVDMQWRNGLPPGWTAARARGFARTLAAYTNEEGAASPVAMREGSVASRRASDRIAEIMATSTTDVDMLAWRGLNRPHLLFGDALKGSLVGAQVRDPSFMSVSGLREVSERYAGQGGFLMRMHVPAGTRAITVDNPDDVEVLLDRGYTLSVTTDSGPGITPRIIDVTVS